MADLTATPQAGNRTEYTAIVGGVLNVVAILCETVFGWDIPPDVWIAANTVLGSVLAIFLGRKVNRTEEAANQAVAGQAKESSNGI